MLLMVLSQIVQQTRGNKHHDQWRSSIWEKLYVQNARANLELRENDLYGISIVFLMINKTYEKVPFSIPDNYYLYIGV